MLGIGCAFAGVFDPYIDSFVMLAIRDLHRCNFDIMDNLHIVCETEIQYIICPERLQNGLIH